MMQITEACKLLLDEEFASTVKAVIETFEPLRMCEEERLARVSAMIEWGTVDPRTKTHEI
jgi:hypothetical protein